jgi:hypothetical protein
MTFEDILWHKTSLEGDLALKEDEFGFFEIQQYTKGTWKLLHECIEIPKVPELQKEKYLSLTGIRPYAEKTLYMRLLSPLFPVFQSWLLHTYTHALTEARTDVQREAYQHILDILKDEKVDTRYHLTRHAASNALHQDTLEESIINREFRDSINTYVDRHFAHERGEL